MFVTILHVDVLLFLAFFDALQSADSITRPVIIKVGLFKDISSGKAGKSGVGIVPE